MRICDENHITISKCAVLGDPALCLEKNKEVFKTVHKFISTIERFQYFANWEGLRSGGQTHTNIKIITLMDVCSESP